MPEKACSVCKVVKPLDEFSRETRSKSGYRGDCKECAKEYYQNNKEERKEYNRQYHKNNREKLLEYHKQYYQNNKESMAERQKQYNNDKYNNNPTFRLRHNVRRLILHALDRNNGSKHGESVMKYLPYTIEQLKEHLESQFVEGMSWENRTEWHLDHVKPQSLLPYDSMSHPNFQKCWALSNLQPLWAADNMSKGNKFEEAIQ